jgi:cell division protein FtsW
MTKQTCEKFNLDFVILGLTIIITFFGIIMIYSSSAVYALEKFHNPYYFLTRQIISALIGMALMIVATFIDYRKYEKIVYLILGINTLLLIAVFIPKIGTTIGHTRRWIDLGIINVQPAEFTKISLIIFLAYSLSKKIDKIKTFTIGFLPHILIPGIILALILKEPDFGTCVVLLGLILTMLLISGARIRYILGLFLSLIPFLYFLVINVDYRKRRLFAFLNPWKDPSNSGFQILQSFIGIREGGLFGQGLGQGTQKLFFLPQAHNDFIFAVIGEELGFIGIVIILGLFTILFVRGITLALKTEDNFGKFLCLGLSMLIALQVIVNVAVNLGLVPTKGLTLPFISYGGSSLITCLIAQGIILNIKRIGSKV